jgi:hypothetical protein
MFALQLGGAGPVIRALSRKVHGSSTAPCWEIAGMLRGAPMIAHQLVACDEGVRRHRAQSASGRICQTRSNPCLDLGTAPPPHPLARAPGDRHRGRLHGGAPQRDRRGGLLSRRRHQCVPLRLRRALLQHGPGLPALQRGDHRPSRQHHRMDQDGSCLTRC